MPGDAAAPPRRRKSSSATTSACRSVARWDVRPISTAPRVTHSQTSPSVPSNNAISIRGYRLLNARRRSGSNRVAALATLSTRSVPLSSPAQPAQCSWTRSTARSAALASDSTRSPISVGATPCRPRETTATPTVSSSARTVWLAAGCVMPRHFAAAVKPPSSTTVTSRRDWPRVILATLIVDIFPIRVAYQSRPANLVQVAVGPIRRSSMCLARFASMWSPAGFPPPTWSGSMKHGSLPVVPCGFLLAVPTAA